MKKGKIIVFEGLDYSFKETNSKKLYEYIKENITEKVLLIPFPNYASPTSIPIIKYLKGEYEELKNTNPYTISTMYALDRYDRIYTNSIYIESYKKEKIIDLYNEGYYIIFDRYVGSNLIHQGSKFDNKIDYIKFISWCLDLEYNKNKLPKPDITIYLNMPVEISHKLIQGRNNKFNSKENIDLHESDLHYKLETEKHAKTICDLLNWKIVNCTFHKQILSKEELFRNILFRLKDNNIF